MPMSVAVVDAKVKASVFFVIYPVVFFIILIIKYLTLTNKENVQ